MNAGNWSASPQYSQTSGFLTTMTTVIAASDIPSAVPEPASMLLLAFGLAGLAAARRRR